jgi:hypothetical protein
MTETKQCCICGEKKPTTEFYFRKDRNCFRSRCKKCQREQKPSIQVQCTCIDCGTIYFRAKSGGNPSERCPECRVMFSPVVRVPAAYVNEILQVIQKGPFTSGAGTYDPRLRLGFSEFVTAAIREYLKQHDEEGNLR